MRKGKLPKPLDKLAGANLMATPLYEVGGDLRVAFVAKTAAAREQRQLYAWAFQATGRWREWTHGHKGLHGAMRGLDRPSGRAGLLATWSGAEG
ncbi:MAG: hypothetical protein IPK39_23600 [Sulfuritalea sp.]|nr:hypothetical protein [Sulfuritalea sp.]